VEFTNATLPPSPLSATKSLLSCLYDMRLTAFLSVIVAGGRAGNRFFAALYLLFHPSLWRTEGNREKALLEKDSVEPEVVNMLSYIAEGKDFLRRIGRLLGATGSNLPHPIPPPEEEAPPPEKAEDMPPSKEIEDIEDEETDGGFDWSTLDGVYGSDGYDPSGYDVDGNGRDDWETVDDSNRNCYGWELVSGKNWRRQAGWDTIPSGSRHNIFGYDTEGHIADDWRKYDANTGFNFYGFNCYGEYDGKYDRSF
jgi:hypothetical protein